MRPFRSWVQAFFFLFAVWTPAPAAPPALRVVSLSPHFTQVVFDIGAGDRLVGVTDFCRYPPAALLIPKVGGLLNPSVETILRLKPDLVLAVPFYGPVLQALRRQGLNVLVRDNSRVSDLLAAYDDVGKALGMEKEARRAKRRFEKRLLALNPPTGPRPSALFLAGTETGTLSQMVAAGGGTYVNEILDKTGFRNVLADSSQPFVPFSREELLRLNPDVIFQTVTPDENGPGAVGVYERLWKKWGSLRAVREGRIYFLTKNEWTVPGPTMVDLGDYLLQVRKTLAAP